MEHLESECSFKNVKCHAFSKHGHLARACLNPQRRVRGGDKEEKRKKVSHVEWSDLDDNDNDYDCEAVWQDAKTVEVEREVYSCGRKGERAIKATWQT